MTKNLHYPTIHCCSLTPPTHFDQVQFLTFGGCINKTAEKWTGKLKNCARLKESTVIVDSGASDIYFAPNAPVTRIDKYISPVYVGIDTGKGENSVGVLN